jgi:hypothetical protein
LAALYNFEPAEAMLIQILQWGSVITASVAAVLWFWSAVVRIRPEYPLGLKIKQVQDLSDAVRKQSKLSAWAALFTGVSVLAQAVAMVLSR